MLKYIKITSLFILSFTLSNTAFSQIIDRINFGINGRNVFIDFNVTPKYDNNEIYTATVFYRIMPSVSLKYRKKLNLNKELTHDIKPGNNIINFDVNYLNDYLGSDILIEFEVQLIPSFIPVSFDNTLLKIGKNNTININYWDKYSNLKYTLTRDGYSLSGNLDKNRIIFLPKSLLKGSYNLTVTNSGLGNDSYSQNIVLK